MADIRRIGGGRHAGLPLLRNFPCFKEFLALQTMLRNYSRNLQNLRNVKEFQGCDFQFVSLTHSQLPAFARRVHTRPCLPPPIRLISAIGLGYASCQVNNIYVVAVLQFITLMYFIATVHTAYICQFFGLNLIRILLFQLPASVRESTASREFSPDVYVHVVTVIELQVQLSVRIGSQGQIKYNSWSLGSELEPFLLFLMGISCLISASLASATVLAK